MQALAALLQLARSLRRRAASERRAARSRRPSRPKASSSRWRYLRARLPGPLASRVQPRRARRSQGLDHGSPRRSRRPARGWSTGCRRAAASSARAGTRRASCAASRPGSRGTRISTASGSHRVSGPVSPVRAVGVDLVDRDQGAVGGAARRLRSLAAAGQAVDDRRRTPTTSRPCSRDPLDRPRRSSRRW